MVGRMLSRLHAQEALLDGHCVLRGNARCEWVSDDTLGHEAGKDDSRSNATGRDEDDPLVPPPSASMQVADSA